MIQNKKLDEEGRVISGKCHCGAMVQLGDFTCECEHCGQLYNWCGHLHRLVALGEWEEA